MSLSRSKKLELSKEQKTILEFYEGSKYSISGIKKYLTSLLSHNNETTYETLKKESMYARICFYRQYQNVEFINRLQNFNIKDYDIIKYSKRIYPKIRFTTDESLLGGDIYGSYYPNTDYIYILSKPNHKDPFHTTVHECIHYLTNSIELYSLNPMLVGFLKHPFYTNFSEFHINGSLDYPHIIRSSNVLEDYSGPKNYFEYKTKHQEIHAELGSLRLKISPKDPWKILSEEELFRQINKLLEDVNIQNGLKFFLVMIDRSKSKEFTQLYNTFF